MNHYSSGPPIEATFVVVPQGVVCVELKLHQKDTFSWKVVERQPALPMIKKVNDWVEAYCNHQIENPLLPVILDKLPLYTRKVLETLYKLPFNDRFTYQELAVLTSNPDAARAVGNACGRNPCPLVIPCHHVFATSGLGGFSLGIEMKKILLEYESFGMEIAYY